MRCTAEDSEAYEGNLVPKTLRLRGSGFIPVEMKNLPGAHAMHTIPARFRSTVNSQHQTTLEEKITVNLAAPLTIRPRSPGGTDFQT